LKKIIPIFIVGILVISGLGAVAANETGEKQTQQEKILLSEPNIVDLGEKISIEIVESDVYYQESGQPLIPKITKVYTYPFGTTIENVDISFSDFNEIQLTKPLKITPEAKILSSINKETNIDQQEQIEIKETFPEQKYSIIKGAGLKDNEHVIYLSINLYPIEYNHNSNIITYAEKADIKIDYKIPEKPITFPDEYDMLIICPDEFSDELAPLVTYKNENDISTILTTLEDIPDVGVDEQESIKYYIKDAIENWGITYVLLVGSGVEGEEKFPVRYAWIPSGNYEKQFPSTLYYADIYDSEGGFSDWDLDGDGKYAEYTNTDNDMEACDMYPDVNLGLLPCNNEREVEQIVEKILYYEKHNKMVNKIIQIGGDTFPGDPEGINEGEYSNVEVLTKLPGYSTTQLWASKTSPTEKLSKLNIAQGFKDGVDFVDFSGHGSYASWATHAPEDDSIWLPAESIISPYHGWLYVDYDLYQLNNDHKYPVVVFNACSCSKYSDSPNCLSWKTLKGTGGGIASFGASGIGYGSYGSHETKRLWGWMEVHLFEGMYNDKIIGQVWSNALTTYINNFISDEWDGADYKTIFEVALFGDPSIAVEDGTNPKAKSLDLPDINSFIERILLKYPLITEILRKINNNLKL